MTSLVPFGQSEFSLVVLPFDRPLITTCAMACNFRLQSKTSDVLRSCHSGRLNASTGVRARLISGQKFQLSLGSKKTNREPNRRQAVTALSELQWPVFPEAAWEASDTSSAKHHNNTTRKKKKKYCHFFPHQGPCEAAPLLYLSWTPALHSHD